MNTFYIFISIVLFLLSIYHQYKIDRLSKYINLLFRKSLEDTIQITYINEVLNNKEDKKDVEVKEKEILND